MLRKAASELASQTPTALSGSIQLVTQFALMLVVLFFFFRDRALLLQSLAGLLPLHSPRAASCLSESRRPSMQLSTAISWSNLSRVL